MRIVLSRTDSIGDVVLTLPMAAALKEAIPGCTVIFLGREYTRPVVELCRWVDEFVVWGAAYGMRDTGYQMLDTGGGMQDTGCGWGPTLLQGLRADAIIHVFPVKEICIAAKQAGIPLRIATSGRFFTLFTCNRLLHIPRKNSGLHESQLNLKLLKGLGVVHDYPLEEIGGMYGLSSHPYQLTNLPTCQLLILHPKSKGSAREWGLENFSALIDLLPADRYNIVISGTKEEGGMMTAFLDRHHGRVTDLTGKLSLAEFIDLIGSADALVAASTGPLHIAAALGIRAVGLYAPMRPIFPQRWAPVGKNATYLVLDKACSDCRKTMDCRCIRSIRPEEVREKLVSW